MFRHITEKSTKKKRREVGRDSAAATDRHQAPRGSQLPFFYHYQSISLAAFGVPIEALSEVYSHLNFLPI